MRFPPAVSLVVVLASLLASGCGLATRAAVGLVYAPARLDGSLVERDVPYLDSGDPKHRLTVVRVPADARTPGATVPTVVFVHGGGWTTGDRDTEVGGADFYTNVGRYLARRGIAATVISYRLQPDATWQDQVADAAAALAWTQSHATDWGGDPKRVAVMGHSAGAQLAAHVALDGAARARAGAGPVCAAVVASGAALDLTDAATWATGTRFGYYSARFAPDRRDIDGPPETPYGWQAEASPVTYATSDAPPFLISTATGESALFETQADALERALDAVGVAHERVRTSALSHELGVPNLSRDDRTIAPATVDFVNRVCRSGGG